MIIKKSKLDFLQVFNSLASTSSSYGDKLFIYAKDNKTHFFIDANKIKIYYVLDLKSELQTVYPIRDLCSLLKTISKDIDIQFNNSGISFGKSIHPLSVPDVSFSIVEDFIETVSQIKKTSKKFQLSALKKLKYNNSFVGNEAFENIHAINNKYVSSDRTIIAISENQSDITDPIIIPADLIKIFNIVELEDDSLSVDVYDNEFLGFNLSGIQIFIPSLSPSTQLLGLFDSGFKDKLELNFNVSVASIEIKEALSRMSFSAKKNPNGAISISFINANMILSSISEDNKSVEEIPCQYSSALEGYKIYIVAERLNSVVNLMKGTIIHFGINPDPEESLMRVSDETNTFNSLVILYEF